MRTIAAQLMKPIIEDGPYLNDSLGVRPVHGAWDALNRLRERGLLLGVVTNQSGVAKGLISPDQLVAVNDLAAVLDAGAALVVKSTVPVGTTRRLAQRLRSNGIRVVSNPEFLRESHAIYDFRHPDRIVIGVGADDTAAADLLEAIYGGSPTVRMSPESSELAKYASNAFLAVKISYANSLARLCARIGADIDDVTRCMGADVRIGQHFLQPGPGWGGSCLPKDTAALLNTGRCAGVELPEVAAARSPNAGPPRRIVETLTRALGAPLAGARVTALGLTFKAGTSDTRDSPALTICAELASVGAQSPVSTRGWLSSMRIGCAGRRSWPSSSTPAICSTALHPTRPG